MKTYYTQEALKMKDATTEFEVIADDLKTLAHHGKPSVLKFCDRKGVVYANRYIEFPCPTAGTLPPKSCPVAVEQAMRKLEFYAAQKEIRASLHVFNQDNKGNLTLTHNLTVCSDGSGFVDLPTANAPAPAPPAKASTAAPAAPVLPVAAAIAKAPAAANAPRKAPAPAPAAAKSGKKSNATTKTPALTNAVQSAGK